MKENNKVLLGMSGGTDSSVAALLLQDAGYEVTGITFRFYEKDGNTEYLDDARDLCRTLGIPHLIYDAREMFQEKIIRYFIQEYMAGRTPVPWHTLQQLPEMALAATGSRRKRYLPSGHRALTSTNKK